MSRLRLRLGPASCLRLIPHPVSRDEITHGHLGGLKVYVRGRLTGASYVVGAEGIVCVSEMGGAQIVLWWELIESAPDGVI